MCSAQIPDGLLFDQAGSLPLVPTTGAQLIERGVSPRKARLLVTAHWEEWEGRLFM